MDAERWRQIEELTSSALSVPASERAAWLVVHSGGDEALRADVASLLAADNECANFLGDPAVAKVASFLIAQDDDEMNRVGQQIGAYKIVAEIGRGGMGVVYVAERQDQFKQRVALKLIKRGLDTEDILRRFQNERQILASLNHPNIGRLFDGGMTSDGLPYFVMEYIEGVPLTKYCNDRDLSVPERLLLFTQACAAVQHAHQNLIIHRDLKPANILVTNDRDVKLLDFGVAKLLNQDSGSDGPTMTQVGHRLMTHEYASPEQIRGDRVTTATDVYSLGVVLYELLTGNKPYGGKKTSREELSRAICETQPFKPSDSLSRKSINAAGGKQAQVENSNRKSKVLRGDLDNIVLMALRKDPRERYKSVAQLSEDIERHLSGLPVRARPATLRYRATKFVQRYRVATAAAFLIFITLVGGVVATLWQARAARREQARAEEIKNFLKRTLNYSNPVLMGNRAADTTVTEVLDDAAKRLDAGEFSNQPEVKAELELIIAEAYNGQGKQEPGLKYFQEAVALMRETYGEGHPKTLVASSLQALLLFHKGDMVQAENIYRRILPLMTENQKRHNITPAELALALNNFGYLRRTQGDSREAEACFRQALALAPQMSNEDWRYINGSTRSVLASTLADQGRFDEALQTAREAVTEVRERGETGTPHFGFALTVLGGFLSEKGEFKEGDGDLREAEAIFRKLLSPMTLWLGDNLRNQSISCYYQASYNEAISKSDEALKIYREGFGPHYDHYPTVLLIKGLSLARIGQTNEGETLIREAVKMRVDELPADHYWVAMAKSALGECLTIQKRYAEAEPLVLESYRSLQQSQGANNPRTLIAKRRIDDLYATWKKNSGHEIALHK